MGDEFEVNADYLRENVHASFALSKVAKRKTSAFPTDASHYQSKNLNLKKPT